jgi:hypothetical protein
VQLAIVPMQTKLSVQQPPRSGNDYPFVVGGERLADVLLDMVVEHAADAKLPLRVTVADNFHAGNLSPSGFRLRIVDREGAAVFDTNTSTYRSAHNWGTYYSTYTWSSDDGRLLRFTVGSANRDDFPATLEDLDAVIDPRAYIPVLPGVRQLSVYDRQFKLAELNGNDAAIRFRNGHNVTYTTAVPPARTFTGEVLQQTVTIEASPGSGLGRFPGCGDATVPVVRTFNRQRPSASGNFLLNGTSCFRVEPVVTFGSNDIATIQHGELRVFDDCEACCDCDDYLRPYYSIQRLKRRVDPLVELFNQLRARYSRIVQRISSALSCIARQKLRLLAAVHRECEIAIVAGVFNGSLRPMYDVKLDLHILWQDENGNWFPAATHHIPAYAMEYVENSSELIPLTNRGDGRVGAQIRCVAPDETRSISFRIGLFGNRRVKVCLGFDGSDNAQYICRDIVTRCAYLPTDQP